MADYIAALGKMASEKASSTTQGFIRGAKGAFLSETPGLTSAAGFVSTMKKYADTKQTNIIAKEQKTTNVINLEMVRQLRAINSNIANQTRLAASAERRAINAAAFAEESERERIVRDDKLLKAIEKIGSANDPTYGKRGGFLDAAKDSLLEKFGVTAAGSAVGTAAAGLIGRLAPALGRVLLNPYVLGALAVALGGYILSKSIKQDSKGKIGFGDGGAMNEAINTGGMTLPSGSGGGGSSTGGGGGGSSGGGGGGGNAPTNAGTQASASTLKWNAPLNGLFRITSPYGEKRKTGIHKGVDLAPADRTVALKVIAAADGRISDIGSRGAYGNFIVIKHSDGYSSLYAHLANLSFAKGLYKGLNVKAGTTLGLVGSTGRSTAPHLHFEIRNNGNHVDPGSIISSLSSSRNDTKEATATGKSGDYPNNTTSPGTQGSQDPTGPTGRNGPAPKSASTDSSYLSGYTSFEERQKNAIGLITPVSSGTSTQNLQGYVTFEEREKRDKLLLQSVVNTATNTKNINKGIQSQNETLKQSTRAVVGRGVLSTGDKVSRYYSSQIESLSRQFQNTTRSLINTTLTSVLFPGKMYGVNRRDAEQPGYLGKILSKEFELQKKMTPFFNKLVGKRFGGQYASIFSQAGGLLLDKGANAIGSMLGFNEQSPFGFGQIVGNLLAKGKKGKEQRKLGREQLIYSMLGIPTGATSGLTFLQKMMPGIFGKGAGGYMTPQQQISGLTDATMRMLGISSGTLGGALGSAMGMIPGPASSLQRLVSVDGMRVTQGDANVLKVQEGFTYDSWETATNQQEGFFNTLGAGLSRVFSNVGGGLADVMGGLMGGNGLGGILNWGFNLLASVFTGSGGGTGGGMFGGGGFFSDLGKAWSGEMSWGEAILNTGMKVGGNIATNYAAYQITKNIKNPYARLAAQQAANYVIKSGLQVGANALGYGDVASKFLGSNTKLADVGNSFVNTLTGASNAGITEATLGELGINTAKGVGTAGGPASVVPGVTGAAPITNLGGGAAITGAGLTDAADIAVSSVLEGGLANAATSGANFVDFAAGSDALGSAATTAASAVADAGGYVVGSGGGFIGESAASSFLDSMPAVADVLPYAAAIVKLFQGDIEGAAVSAAGAFIGNLIFPGIGGILGGMLGSFIGGSKEPEPWVTYGIRVNNNNDPNAYGLTFAGRRGVPGELHTACIGLLKTLFAMIKKAQLTLGIPKLAHDYFTIHMNARDKVFSISVGNAPVQETSSDGEGSYTTTMQHGQEWGRAAKDVSGGNFDDLKTTTGFAKISEPLLNAMLQDVSDKDKATAKASISKLTTSELTSGAVSGVDQSIHTDIYGRNLYEKNFRSGRTIAGDPEFGTYWTDNPNTVYNAKTGQTQEETNLMIGGYNVKGEAVDLKGNVIDFNKFSSSAGFTGWAAVRQATEGGFTGSGEDAYWYGPTPREVFNAKTGKYQVESNNDIVGYDKDGKPVSLKAEAAARAAAEAAARTAAVEAEAAARTAATVTSSGGVISTTLDRLQSENTDLKTALSSGTNNAVLNSGNQVNTNVDNSTTIVNETSSNRTWYGTRTSEFELVPA